MKKIVVILSAVGLTAGVVNAQNLLLNGDFNSPASTAAPDNWTTWSYGAGYANHELPTLVDHGIDNTGIYDGTYQMTCGATDTASGGGVFQIVPATAGVSYSLTVDAGAQAWWLPSGELRLFFLDASDAQLDLTTVTTTDSIHNPDQYDVGVPYQSFGLTAMAPAGTTQAKVEFAGFGGGSAWFDNASLTVVPEPGTAGLLILGSAFFLGRRFRSRNRAGA